MVTTHQSIIKSVSRFQRAIHVRYDLRDADAVEQYIPTQSATNALKVILQNTRSEQTQRAHVLHAAYGSGKSHFAVALAALLENSSQLQHSIHGLIEHFAEADVEVAHLAQVYVGERNSLFPVILSGDEGNFAHAMLRGLMRALKDTHIDISLNTRFKSAIETIERWETDYPEFAKRLKSSLKEHDGRSLTALLKALADEDDVAYKLFVDLYAELTAGAVFDPLVEQSPEIIYRDTVEQLRHYGYTGIVVIWDEFGRYLEAHTSQAFGNEAAMLQGFAETCNYSDDAQLHLLLFTHKELQGYASSLPQSYQQEWSRIEGRFQRHDLSTDPLIAYRLIASAIQHTDPALVYEQLRDGVVNWFLGWTKDYRLFGNLPEQDIRHLIYNTWPLHPLTVFALAHLSNRVAQNERTMFTFLTSDEPNALRGLVEQKVVRADEDMLIRIADIWDYFEGSVRADIGGSGAHRHWSGVANALDKIAEGDEIGTEAVKALGVLAICADATAVKPTTDLIAWAVGVDVEDGRQAVTHALDNLRRRKAVIHRQIDGYWTFISGSDINFEELLHATLERVNPSPIQLRRLLESTMPAPYTLARRYNQERAMIRFFTGIYRWADELIDAPWDVMIDELATDGLIVYILVTDEIAWQTAIDAVQTNKQVIYVLPRAGQPLVSLVGILRELFALEEISNDATLRQNGDSERINREIDWLREDALGRLENIILRLVDPRQDKSEWLRVVRERDGYHIKGYRVHSPGQTTRIVSDICDEVFPKTPVLNSEGLNRRNPTGQQNKASEMVINALFSRELDETLGIEGRGPEVLALNALLKVTGILRQDEKEHWILARPADDQLGEVWDNIEAYLDDCAVRKQTLELLVTTLTQSPFGIREGVLPILIASVMRSRLMVTSMWHGRSPVSTIDGATLLKIIEKPDEYTLQIGHWSPMLEDLWHVLSNRFDEYIQDIDRDKQPLARLRSGMTRWLHGLPKFCRETKQISSQAIQFRDVIRKIQTEPAKAVFETLPKLLQLDDTSDKDVIASKIDQCMQEISNAYYDLQQRLDAFIVSEFGYTGMTQSGLIAIKSWLMGIPTQNGMSIHDLKFSSTMTQNLVSLLASIDDNDGQFWHRMSDAMLGVALRDWNDNSEARFQEHIQTARDEIQRDVHELIEENKAVSFAIQMPDGGAREFRFRSSDISQHGQRLLQNFKSTMDIAGRPLSVDERRKIALAFFVHVMGEDLDE